MDNDSLTEEERLQRAAADGDADAAFKLSQWYLEGHIIEDGDSDVLDDVLDKKTYWGISQDISAAEEYLEQAASLGHRFAQQLARQRQDLVRRRKRLFAVQGAWSNLATLVLLVSIAVPLMIVGYQVFMWLKTGAWPPIPVYAGAIYIGIDAPINTYLNQLDWLGVQKILIWIYFDMPLSFFAFLAGLVLFVATAGLANTGGAPEESQREAEESIKEEWKRFQEGAEKED